MAILLQLVLISYFFGYELAVTPTFGSSDCSTTTTDVSHCLDGLRTRMLNMSQYFFGDSYPLQCPFTSDNINCFNVNPSPASLASRMFGSEGLSHTKSFSLWIDVRYDSPADTHFSCGHEFVEPHSTFRVNPLQNTPVKPWTTRMFPHVTWNPASKTTLYVMMILDPGFQVLHGLIVNIPGNEVAMGNTVYPYRMPLNIRHVTNVYAFLLFEQSVVNLTVGQDDFPFSSASSYDVLTFIKRFSLGLLKGINWIEVDTDAYAAETLGMGISFFCGISVTDEAIKQNIATAILQSNPVPSVSVVLRYEVAAGTYTDCCGVTVATLAADISVDAIGNQVIPSQYSEAPPELHLFSVTIVHNSLLRYLHTLVIADFGSDDPETGTQSRPIIHSMITNIANGSLTSGDVILPYMVPIPRPNQNPHTFVVLILRQNHATTHIGNLSEYGTSIDTTYGQRYLFKLNNLMADNGLSFAGMSWFRLRYDDFTPVLIKRHYASCDANCQATACASDAKFKLCSSGSGHLIAGFAVVMSSLLFVWVHSYSF